MSKYPSSSSDDASSVSNQPLISKTPQPKDYEAAAAALMSSYGLSGATVQSMPTPSKQKKETKSPGSSKSSSSSNPSSNATSKK